MHRILRLAISLFIFSLIGYSAFSQPNNKREKNIISGHIKDSNDGENLIGATIYVKELGVGAVSNSYGFYSLSLAPGTYTLRISYIGYKNYEHEIELGKNIVLDFELSIESEIIEEIIVSGEEKDQNLRRIEMGVEKLQSKTIKSIPSLLGEVDLIKAIQLLPGVQSTSEGGSGFSVRGGSSDQNLILLDEATVYNASHLMGFFSVFNNDAIKDLKLYKGDVPAQYGGRLSSLLDVRMKDGNSKKFTGTGGIGLISSRLTLEGPIKKDQTTFIISGRRTYLDLFLLLSSDSDVKSTRLYFYDANTKVTHRFDENNRLFLSGYFGRDVMRTSNFRMGFGNKTFTGRWNHIFSQKIFMNVSMIWSKYDYELGTASDEPESWLWESSLEDYGVKADFGYFISPLHSLKFGVQSFYHKFKPGYARGVGENSVFGEYSVDNSQSWEHGIYSSFEQKIGSKFILKYGLRASLFQNVGDALVYKFDEDYNVIDTTRYGSGDVYKNYWGFEPRFGINYMINSNLSLKFNYSHSIQYVQQASNSTAGSPLDVWFPASPNVKPQNADLFVMGVFKNYKNSEYQFSAEVYYKKMRNTIDFKDHAELLLNKELEGELRIGSSRAYGLELMMKKTEGPLTGWLSYTLSRAERTIPGINQGRTYLAPYDKTNDISAVFNYQLNKRISLSANWIFATGQPVTFPVQRYEISGSIIPYYTDRNGSRYEDYHRLDLSLTLQTRKSIGRKWKAEWVFSVYNAYNRKNTWILNFLQDADNPTVTYAEKTYLFPMIPSISYNFKF